MNRIKALLTIVVMIVVLIIGCGSPPGAVVAM